MTQTQEIARRQSTEPQAENQAQVPAQEPEHALVPPADIFEDADGITIQLDMPGVVKDGLTVKADRNGLLVEGDASIAMPEGLEAVYAEIRTGRYRRSFTLTGELDADGIEASIKDGVLAIRVPKRPELKLRRIEVQTV
jgi:HSP20 family molecular chaperone IbpA